LNIFNSEFESSSRLKLTATTRNVSSSQVYGMISQAPGFNPAQTYGYITINTTDPEPVKAALEQFWEVALGMVGEMGPDFDKLVKQEDIRVLVSGTTVILVVYLSENDSSKVIVDYVKHDILQILGEGGIDASAGIETEIGVDTMISDPEFAKKAGDAMKAYIKVDTNTGAMKRIREIWAARSFGRRDKILCLLFNSLDIQLNFTTQSIGEKYLKTMPVQTRDGMVNMAKGLWGNFGGMLEDYPFAADLLDVLQENAQCELRVGVVSENINVDFEVYLPGLLSVWDVITK